jgi:hypothetical protein
MKALFGFDQYCFLEEILYIYGRSLVVLIFVCHIKLFIAMV